MIHVLDPFISFEDIFYRKWKKKKLIFGELILIIICFQFIQSNFLVFKKNTFRIKRQYFIEEIDEKAFFQT